MDNIIKPLNKDLKRHFAKENSFPIVVFDEPYFTYDLDLYEPLLKSKTKFEEFTALLKKIGEQQYHAINSTIINSIQEKVKNTKSFSLLQQQNWSEQFPLTVQIGNRNIYNQEFVGKNLISIDLRKANFNCLNLIGVHKELNIFTYEDLISTVTTEPYFSSLKRLRQVIFGGLNPKSLARLQQYTVSQIAQVLQQHSDINIITCSSDELILEASSFNAQQVNDILINKLEKKFHYFRVEEFNIKQLHPEKPFFLKTVSSKNENKIEFKSVPDFFYAQVFKNYFSLPLDFEMDMVFFHEGQLAKFISPLYPEIKKTISFKNN